MLAYVYQFLSALLISVAIEGLVVLALASYLKLDRKLVCIAICGTALTIPYVWFVFPTVFWYSSPMIVWFGEGFAFLVEALLYRTVGKVSWPMAFLLSLSANGTSYFFPRIY